MSRLASVFIAIFICLFASSCIVKSNTKLLLTNKGTVPLPANSILYQDGSEKYEKINCYTDKCILTDNTGKSRNVTFYQYKNTDNYIIQTDDEYKTDSYVYCYITIKNGKILLYDFDLDKINNSLGLPKDTNVNTEYVIKLFDTIIDNNKQILLYDIFDSNDKNAIMAINEKIEIVIKNKKSEEEKRQKIAEEEGKKLLRESVGWSYIEKRDPMNDSINSYIAGVPSMFDGSNKSPIFYMSCSNGTKTVSINWNSSLRSENGNNDDIFDNSGDLVSIVEVRFDKNKSEKLIFRLSNDRDVTYEGNKVFQSMHHMAINLFAQLNTNIDIPIAYWNGDVFGKAIMNSNEMTIRATKSNRYPVTAIFNTKGYKDVIKNFPTNCQ